MEKYTKKYIIVEEEIKAYLKRLVPDVARKCNTKDDNVIKIIKELYGKN